MVETFGEGAFDGYLDLTQEPLTHSGGVSSGRALSTRTCTAGGPTVEPDRWPVVVQSFDGEDVPFDCQAAEFACRILTDPHGPFAMARYFDTHWLMNYRESVRPNPAANSLFRSLADGAFGERAGTLVCHSRLAKYNDVLGEVQITCPCLGYLVV